MPQPIDPNTELARVTATDRIQQIADRVSLAAQTRTAAAALQEQVDVESQVQQMTQKNQQVDDELKRRSPYVGKRRRKKKGGGKDSENDSTHTFYNAAEHAEVADDPEEHNIDVTV